jgi:hypothetical protein
MARSKKSGIVAKTDDAALVLADLSELARSYVASGVPMWTQMSRSLPQYIDDLERDFKPRIYKRMMIDPIVRGNINTLRMRVLENGLTFLPAMDPPTASKATQKQLADYKMASTVADFITYAHSDMVSDVEDVLFEMLGSMVHGHRLAEQVMRTELGGQHDGDLVMDALETKPRANYAFVVDSSNRTMGIVAAMPGISLSVPTGWGGYYQDLPNFLGTEKFFRLTYQGEDGLPSGDSCLRPVYTPWHTKQQIWPQLLRYIIQFAGPSLIGYTPPGETGSGTGNKTAGAFRGQPYQNDPESLMRVALEMFQSSTIAVFRNGAKVDLIQSTGEGRAHMAAMDLCDRQITYGILSQVRATMEAANGSRADSDSATDVLDVLIRWLQSWVQRAYRKQVVRNLVVYKFGANVARRFTPRPMLQQVAKPDFAAEATAVAALQQSGYLHPSQYPELDSRLGLPERDMDAVMEEI